MTNYKKVPPDTYLSIKNSLMKDYILSQYPSFHDSRLESFGMVSLDGKISVYYYKNGIVEIEGSEDNPTYRRIIKRVNGLISKKDYI